MSKRPRCKPGAHNDRRMRGGRRVCCSRCGDVFPCRHDCEHFDCMIATGRALPEWATVRDKEAGED